MTHEQLKSNALSNSTVKEEYDALDLEFNLLREMLAARKKMGLSQAEVAKRMGTKPPAVTRLESALTSGKHSPSISTIKKYARAIGYHVEIKLIQN